MGKVQSTHAPERLTLLDGLRTFAALGVMLYHAPNVFGFPEVVGRMYLLVDLFFMLSGFVLTLSAEPRMRAGLGPLGFVRLRVIRLWPLTALGAVMGAGAFLIAESPGHVLNLLPLSLTLLPLLSSSVAIFPLNSPQWSIFWEIVANFCHAALLWQLSERMLLAVAAISGACLLAAIEHSGWAGFGPNGPDWWLAFFRIAWAYSMGAWMARRWSANRPAPQVSWLTALLSPVAALAFLPFVPLTIRQGDALYLTVALPLFFWLAATAVPPKSAERSLSWLGSLSFPLYAVHFPIILGIRFATDSRDYELHSVLVSVALAIVIARVGPGTRRGWKRLMNTGKPAAQVSAA